MIIANVIVQASSAKIKILDQLPVGASGLKVKFQFTDPAWSNLSKTAVFRNREKTYDANIMNDCATIPHEVLAKAMEDVDVGVYGTDSSKSIAIPTVWTKLGTVMSGAKPTGSLSKEATLPYWVQIKEQVDVIQNNMMDQEDLENALIQAKNSGAFDGPRGEKGDRGADGKNPVRGVDYWTTADIAEIKSYVDEAILGGAW